MLRRQVQLLETKNRKYLEVIGGTSDFAAKQVTAAEIRETTKLTKQQQLFNIDELTDILEQCENQLSQKQQENEILKAELDQAKQQLVAR